MNQEPDNPANELTGSVQPSQPSPIDYATPSRRKFPFLSSTAIGRIKWLSLLISRSMLRVLLVLIIFAGFMLGFGTNASDAEKMRVFSDSVDRWQTNPDFRKAQIQYAEQGSEAMRTKVAFVDTTKDIMWLRSLPFLPDHLKVNDTSLAHYSDFTRGPLSAYMHLTGEQGLSDTLKMLGDLGSKEKVTDEDIRQFLHSYKLHNPVVDDAGAIKSVRSLMNDVDPGRKFEVTADVGQKLQSHIAVIAGHYGFPADPKHMNPAEQLKVWQNLDSQVHETEYELWRTKQVNDWLNGVWAQVYGTMYSGLINPVLLMREIGRIAGPMVLMAWIGLAIWKRKRASELNAPPGAMHATVG